MYSKRIKIFVVIALLGLVVCVARLAQMQLLSASSVQNEIAELKRQRGQSKQLKTIRGRILDRNGNVLAVDEAQFWIHIDYSLSSYLDPRFQRYLRMQAAQQEELESAILETNDEIRTRLDDLQLVIEKCALFKGVEPAEIMNEIQKNNDYVWDLRIFQAWRRKFPDSEVRQNYASISSVRGSEAIADFENKIPESDERIALAGKVDIMEMHRSWPLLKLDTDDDIFAAQLEFMNTDGIQILPTESRIYPYGSVAAQTIGWVGPATQKQDKELFEDDRLSSYQGGELCGREDGVEYACEAILRGRRGEEIFNIDGELISSTDTQFGSDVALTLDIELQKRIEDYLTNYPHDPNCGPGMSAVVIEVGTGDVLALVSLPTYDLNRVRYDYGELVRDRSRKPMINRAVNEQYPPGSVVKPVILIAGMETEQVTAEEVISCPPQKAPPGWPNCLIYNRYQVGHDGQWKNDARNAIKGSCNVYFSRLADRIDPALLQQWLYAFGYGRDILFIPETLIDPNRADIGRDFKQSAGIIWSGWSRGTYEFAQDMPSIRPGERRMFGIGQGNLRVTPLQVANAMATLAREGVFRLPRLFYDAPRNSDGVDIGVSLGSLAVVYDGMNSVVNEYGGTAYARFQHFLRILSQEDVKVYGKTGSTERPEHAWFAGFAQDSTARKIALAVVVENGQSGSRDAAPLARDIFQFCIEAGYIGQSAVKEQAETSQPAVSSINRNRPEVPAGDSTRTSSLPVPAVSL